MALVAVQRQLGGATRSLWVTASAADSTAPLTGAGLAPSTTSERRTTRRRARSMTSGGGVHDQPTFRASFVVFGSKRVSSFASKNVEKLVTGPLFVTRKTAREHCFGSLIKAVKFIRRVDSSFSDLAKGRNTSFVIQIQIQGRHLRKDPA
jgi:hypothetical protein